LRLILMVQVIDRMHTMVIYKKCSYRRERSFAAYRQGFRTHDSSW